MAQHDRLQFDPLDAALGPRLRLYLPADLADTLLCAGAPPPRPSVIQAFVHLACARSAIHSYLPRMLSDRLLRERLRSPWLHWLDGTLLFADLSGSTALAERLSTLGREGTEIVTACLNQVFALLIQVIHDYGGDLVAFGGDALLAFFGDDRHARAAARAALALQAAMRGYVQEVPGAGSFPMHLHVGVESGRVAFASAGGDDHLHYSALGAAVNRVAAAEALAQPNEVVVGPGAWPELAALASADEVAPGFWRLAALRAPARPHLPLPEEEPIDAAPEQAIPLLLDDLDQISRYIPPALLRRILAEPQLPHVEADLRPVTVLFAQVLGLEALAEALPPDAAARALQLYIGAMHAVAEQFGGMVNKLDVADQGVKLVAIFGAPLAYEDHPARAARAALEMQLQLETVNRQIAGQIAAAPSPDSAAWPTTGVAHAPPIPPGERMALRQRIGLNLGTAFAGNVGSAARKEYTVMGDAVNVAARVMSAAEWGQVWCSEAAARAIGGQIACDDRGYLALKGKALPVQLFRLAGPRDAPAAPVLAAGRLIGRGAEQSWLRAQLDAALSGAGRAVRVVGDAGIGKSRLVAALAEAAQARGVRVIHAACFSYTAGIPYAAWGEWLKAFCAIASGDSDELRAHKIRRALALLGPGMDEWLPLLGDLAKLDVPDNRLTRGLDPQLRQVRRFELIEQLLLHAASSGPLLTLFEDLHWADPISLDLWRRVAGALGGRPALLLAAHRPGPMFDAEPDGAQVLALSELSDSESGDLVAALAGQHNLPAALVRQLVERAAGNPLFLSELLRVVMQRWEADQLRAKTVEGLQAIEPQPANLQLFKPLAETLLDNLPDSLSGLLLARIDQLDDGTRTVLRLASVIGQRIPFGVLQSIQNFDQQVLLRELARLDAADLTALERSEPERVHAFRHALIQEVAYQSMLYARRRELHGRIGEYLERRHSGDLDDYYGLLAHHYRLSDRRDKAVEFLIRAGQSAQAVYANDEAIQSYGWALDALAGDDADPRARAARDALGDVLATIGRYDEALAQHAAVLATPGVAPEAAQRAHRKRGNVLEKQGQYGAALAELGQAMALVRSGAQGISALAVAMICADIGLVRQRLGEYDLAIAACEEGLLAVQDDPDSFDDEKTEARLHSTLGAIYGMRGDYPRAHQHFERSLALRTLVDDLPGTAASHNNLGYLWQLQSEYERAIEHYAVAEELAKKINLRFLIAFAIGNSAYSLICLGKYDLAEQRCGETLVIVSQLNAQHDIAQTHNTLGIVFYHKGEYDRAIGAFGEALRLNRQLGSVYQEANSLMHMALALLRALRLDEAYTCAAQAFEHAQRLHSQGLQVESLNALAQIELERGTNARTRELAGQALDLAEKIGSRREAGVAQRLLAQVAARRGEPFRALFEASVQSLSTIKDRFELGRTWAAYGLALAQSGNQSDGGAYLKRAKDTFISIGANGELKRLRTVEERSV